MVGTLEQDRTITLKENIFVMSTSAPACRIKPKTRKEKMDEAFAVATRGLAADVPVLIHGAMGGRLQPSNSISNHDENKDKFDPELTATAARDTHQLIAALTAQYIHKLVDAALDVSDLQLFGDSKHYGDSSQLLPPPPLEILNQPHSNSLRRSVDESVPKNDLAKRTAAEISYWDKPLPKPKIRGRQDPQLPNISPDKWVGVAGLDMWENSSARATYTHQRSILPQHFIFPLCHDSYVYGRIRELQAAKVNDIEPLLRDTTVLDAIRTEGQFQHEEMVRKRRRIQSRKKSKKKINTNGQNSDEDSDNDYSDNDSDQDDENGPAWPGLDQLLPVNRFSKAM